MKTTNFVIGHTKNGKPIYDSFNTVDNKKEIKKLTNGDKLYCISNNVKSIPCNSEVVFVRANSQFVDVIFNDKVYKLAFCQLSLSKRIK